MELCPEEHTTRPSGTAFQEQIPGSGYQDQAGTRSKLPEEHRGCDTETLVPPFRGKSRDSSRNLGKWIKNGQGHSEGRCK